MNTTTFLKSLAKEPLLYFIAIALILLGLGEILEPPAREIVISEGRVEHLRSVFERKWHRYPTDSELEQLIENYLREEILYREALALGLAENDTVIRRRLRMKMELTARNFADTQDPGDRVLEKFLQGQADKYWLPPTLSFQQRFFSVDLASSDSRDFNDLLMQLNSDQASPMIGDSTLLPAAFIDTSEPRIDRQFGLGFSAQLSKLPVGEWSGPVRSTFGDHLVLLEEIKSTQLPALAEIRSRVLNDWQSQAQKKILQEQYLQYRKNYEVTVHKPDNFSAEVAVK